MDDFELLWREYHTICGSDIDLPSEACVKCGQGMIGHAPPSAQIFDVLKLAVTFFKKIKTEKYRELIILFHIYCETSGLAAKI